MEKRKPIQNFYGIIMGYIITDSQSGNERATDFYGRILGYYNKNNDTTCSFTGQILNKGNTLASLISDAFEKRTK